MQNINFEEGYKEFAINNDESRILRFNPADVNLLNRIQSELKKIGDYAEQFKDEQSDLIAEDIDKVIRERIDDMFYEGASKIIFQEQNVITTINGVTVFERFFKALVEIMKPYIEKENRKTQEKMAIYKKQHDRITAENINNQQ